MSQKCQIQIGTKHSAPKLTIDDLAHFVDQCCAVTLELSDQPSDPMRFSTSPIG